MRHRKGGFKLNRTREHRKAMFENMVTALLEYGRIETTVAKAKAVRPVAERIITKAKNKNLHFQKMVYSIIPKKEVVKKLFDQIAPSFADRPGGYTRIIRTHVRRGDAVEMAILELVNYEVTPKVAAGEKEAKPEKKAEKKEKPAKAPKEKKAKKPKKEEK
jgi:large subunit ribosomal protein L17